MHAVCVLEDNAVVVEGRRKQHCEVVELFVASITLKADVNATHSLAALFATILVVRVISVKNQYVLFYERQSDVKSHAEKRRVES